MTRRFPPLCLLALAVPLPVAAQVPQQAPSVVMVQAVPGSTDADRLAAQMRLLAINANDVSALLAAGELSVKLDDLGAAASFFSRADRIDPRNGRAKAGEGAILVHAERPGEALRYFAQAESYGLAPAAFAADRGLAFDLIGEQERAQRDYRLALRTAADEETQRRYALSLAIADKRELADQELQPLLRKSDRGAWRVHAFVLAMGGNVAEASRIATTMMPPGTAAGLQPFLEKLPTLGPIDRAFAVHFGEVRSTPQRVADARLAPALPALGADPYAPRVAVAAVAAPVEKGKRRGKEKPVARAPVQVAVATPTPTPEPLPQAPSYRGVPGAAPVQATRGAAPAAWPTAIVPGVRPSPAPVPSTVTLTASQPTTLPPRPVAPPSAQAAPAAVVRTPTIVAATSAPPPETNVVVAATGTPSVAVLPSAPGPALPSTPPVAAPASPPPVTDWTLAARPTAITRDPPQPALATIAPPATTPPATVSGETAAIQRRSDDAVDRIVAALPIPGAELNVAGPVRPLAAAPAAAKPEPAAVQASAEQAAIDRVAADRAATARAAADKAATDRAAAAQAQADKRVADRKAAADRKALADKKAAAAKKADEAREAAAHKKLERANPERIWVQVSGGAYAADLPKAWAAAKAKGGDLFAGHATGWTTPLRFTNRVLAGPFKTDAEARTFVNKLRAKGLSGFTFTSDAGQVVRKLDSE